MKSFKKPRNILNRGFVYSVNAALEGVVHTLRTERNMRIHFLAGFFVVIAGLYFDLSDIKFMILCFAVTFVLVAEMFNTAIEHVADLISEEYHPTVKLIKDIAAGAVFVSVVNAVITGYILLVMGIQWGANNIFFRIKQSPWHVTLIALLAVTGLVLFIKILRKEPFLLRGGMPSGHTAVAFAIWIITSFLSENTVISALTFLLALLIAKSRLERNVHTPIEVIAGGALGALAALLACQILL